MSSHQRCVLTVNQKANIPGYDNEIWFSEKGIANVLSFVHTLKSGLTFPHKKPSVFTLKRKKFNDTRT